MVLTTVEADKVDGDPSGQNASYAWSRGPNVQTADAELLSFLPSGIDGYDSAILTMDFMPNGYYIQIDYVFGSDEYPEYVYSDFSDAFGF